MPIETTRYIRKPLYVDVVRITAANFDEVVSWCQGEIQQEEVPGKGTTKKFIKIRVHQPKNIRQTQAFIGDWILYTDRGYKIYTNKAFQESFDEVGEGVSDNEEDYQDSSVDIPSFYFDKNNGWLTEEPPNENAKPLTLEELMNLIKNEVSSEGRYLRREREAALHGVPSIHRSEVKNVEDVANQETIVPAAAEGKRVLSIAEQEKLTAEEIRDQVQSGEAVLAQDLSERPSGRPRWTNGLD